MNRQLVVHLEDGSYVVRTYAPAGDQWTLVREAPANARSVAQATLNGDVVDLADAPSTVAG